MALEQVRSSLVPIPRLRLREFARIAPIFGERGSES
jgi:hypothetical protein